MRDEGRALQSNARSLPRTSGENCPGPAARVTTWPEVTVPNPGAGQPDASQDGPEVGPKKWRLLSVGYLARPPAVAFDFFTVPTLTFQLLYCFFVIEHGRRRMLHFNVTRHPTAEWVVQQLREALPEAGPYRYVIPDRDTKFNSAVIPFLQSMGLTPKRTSVQALWQNGISERWTGSCRREMLGQVFALNEQHLRRLIRDYVSYYHQDRILDSLEEDTPNRRPVEHKPSPNSVVIPNARVGGLHHRYSWREAA